MASGFGRASDQGATTNGVKEVRFTLPLRKFGLGQPCADFVEKVGARIGCNSNEAVFAEVRTA
jgi:hypothetical protein